MGCDIHLFLEHSNDGKRWQALINNAGSRNYVMFGVLAGVRVEDAKLFDPKGLPDGKLSWTTEGAYWLMPAPEDKPDFADMEGWCSRDNAERWVASGYSQHNKDKTRVSDPDAHSCSWLTTGEVGQALEHYRSVVATYWPTQEGIPTEWAAIYGAMKAIEENGDMARVVFWFDN